MRNEKLEAVPQELAYGTKNKKACHENYLVERKVENRDMRTALRNEKQKGVP